MVQNKTAVLERKSRPGTRQQRKLLFKIRYVFCLSCPSATFALQHGGFLPRKWLAAKSLLVLQKFQTTNAEAIAEAIFTARFKSRFCPVVNLRKFSTNLLFLAHQL